MILLVPFMQSEADILTQQALNDVVLLDLPRRRFVFTIPEALRQFLRRDHRVLSWVSRLDFGLVAEFDAPPTCRRVTTGMFVATRSTAAC